MNILLCNNRYFISGGPERYMFSVIELLENNGHKVVPFSINYANNKKTIYSKYFTDPPLNAKCVYFSDSKLSFSQKIKLFSKTIYNFEAGKKIKEVIKKENIDLVYVLQAVNFLYSSVIIESWKLKVPVLARLSDFQLICPAYTFYRNGEICEDCKAGYFWAIRNKCLQNSYGVTFGRVLAMYAYKLLKIQEKIDVIISPSKFLHDKIIEFGIDRSKVVNIPSYVDIDEYEPSYIFESYILYVGNIQKYKGLDILLKAFKAFGTNVKLKIVGGSNDGEDKRLVKLVEEEGIRNVEFLGFKEGIELKRIYQRAMFIVVPSLCYENMPNVILESMALGKPVIGSKIGSIPELIEENVDGLLFEPGNVEDLTEKIQYLIENQAILSEMGKRARLKIEEKYNPDLHYERLMKVYQHMLKGKRGQL